MEGTYTAYPDSSEAYTFGGFIYTGGGGSFLTDTQLTIIAVAAAILGFFIMVSNATVIFSILRPKNKDRLRTPTNILISQLSTADFFVGALTIPFFVLQYHGLPHSYVGCVLTMGVSSMVPTVVSFIGCLFLSMERYLAIQHPFIWERVVNKYTLAMSSAFLWTYAVCYNLSIFGYNKGWNRMNICAFYLLMKTEFLVYLAFLVNQLLPFLLMVFMYTRIFMTARRHILRVDPTGQQQKGGDQPKVSLGKQIRAAQKCFVIVAAIMVCVLPSGVANTISLIFGLENLYVQITLAVLIFFNSAINPFLYVQSNRKLKSEVLKLIFFWKKPHHFDVNDSIQTTGGTLQ